MTTPTVDDIAGILGRELTSDEVARASVALRFATAAVAAYLPDLGLTEVDDETVKLHGNWSRFLQLPRSPVTAVDTVSINGVELDASSWRWRGKDVLVRGPWYPEEDTRDDAFDVLQGAAAGPVYHWGGPEAVVEVTYSYGLATLPDAVWLVIVQSARRLFLNPEGVKQEALGGYSVTYDSGDGAAGLTAGEIGVLRQYRKRAR